VRHVKVFIASHQRPVGAQAHCTVDHLEQRMIIAYQHHGSTWCAQ